MAIMCALVLIGDAGAAATEPSGGYTAVQRAFLREEFEQVVGLAQTFILQYPNVPDVPRVWLWMALSLDRLQQANEALRELNRLKSRLPPRDPLWPELLFWEGDISRRAFQMVRARGAYQQLLQRHAGSTWALQAQLGLGLIDLHQQACESAIPSFRLVAERAPDSPSAREARLFEGLCQLHLKQHGEAISLFEPLLKQFKEPANIAQTAFYLGESFSGLERYDEAVAAYQRAVGVEDAPRWSRPALFGLGWAYYRLDRCPESVQVFEEYLTASTGDHRSEATFAQASCLLKMGQEQEALALFERILDRDPSHPLAIDSGLILADISRRQGRLARAKGLLQELLRRRPNQAARAGINLRLGSIALEEGEAARAKTLFTIAGETDEPEMRQAALNGLGDVQMFLGDLGEARRLYEEARQAAADTPLAAYAAYQLGRIALQLRSFDEAVETFKRLSTSAAGGVSDDARLALALAYLNMGREQLAQSVLDVLRRRHASQEASARAAYYLALMAMDRRDEARARALCEEAIAGAPLTEEAIDAQLLLADMNAREASVDEAMRRLRQAYGAEGLPRRHRAKLAKRLGDFARTQRAFAEAVVWYEEAAALLPTLGGEAAYRIASCYEDAGDLDLAMQHYREIEQPPWRVRGRLALAKLLERDDRASEAAAVYRALAQEAIPEAKVAQERLMALQRETQRSRAW